MAYHNNFNFQLYKIITEAFKEVSHKRPTTKNAPAKTANIFPNTILFTAIILNPQGTATAYTLALPTKNVTAEILTRVAKIVNPPKSAKTNKTNE